MGLSPHVQPPIGMLYISWRHPTPQQGSKDSLCESGPPSQASGSPTGRGGSRLLPSLLLFSSGVVACWPPPRQDLPARVQVTGA